MNKDATLLILAAGMGSRFGGLKQIEPMGPNDEFIIDYSVYDAIKAGFNKIVFIKDKLVYYRDNVKSLTRRYRNGMWNMLKKRHMLVEEYFKAHNIKDKDRLIASAFYAIYVSVTNSYLHGNVTECVKELRAIRKDPFAVKTLKEIRTKLLRPRQKMFYMLFKLRYYHLVYYFRNTMF